MTSQRMRRRHERELEAADAIAAPAPRAGGASDPEIERAVASLPEAQRAAITLFYYQDRSVGEVALAMEIPENTVKTHLHRGRAALRRALERQNARGRNHGLR